MKWTREEYLAHMKGEYIGKEMFCELFGPLIGLEDEWRAQGATPDELSLAAFGWDYVQREVVAVKNGAITNLQERVIEDTPEHKIIIDNRGRKSKLCKRSATIPLPMEFPVTCMDDWLKIKHWYTFSEDRINKEALMQQKKRREEGTVLTFGIPGGFDEPRELMGEENLCCAFYEEPELIVDMLETFRTTSLKTLEIALDICGVDSIHCHEDLAGKSGPLIGPIQINEFIKPYYSKIWEMAKQGGTSLFSIDSDGNINPVIDSFLDCGVNAIYPLEPAAGMDIVELRKKYGKTFAMKGGLDKHALRKSKEDIRRELEYKICDLTKGGGVVFGLDHRIPNGVPIENYRYYVQLARELLGLPAPQNNPHQRMAW